MYRGPIVKEMKPVNAKASGEVASEQKATSGITLLDTAQVKTVGLNGVRAHLRILL